MLELKGIKKDYISGNQTVHALRGVSVSLERGEFVAVLGPSGCGKTTLLNIVGGLDRYTEGDLIINGTSTKRFKDADWDSYRNHSVGFVFQSYNLIPHQTVLSNVELALTLSGIGKRERRRRAEAALKKVGLADQMSKKPNQLSGGQMQRVAIARALVNDPDIILADEPTGALDSETSVQVMELLREAAGDKLIIMVTHNAELAELYATRIIRLLDGEVISDETNPNVQPSARSQEGEPSADSGKKRVSMSFLTALSLSLNNLMTKKGRTILTAFAGSIGIIGIALILSISDGFQNYIDRVQQDTLSNYPLTIESEVVDMSSFFQNRMDSDGGELTPVEEGKVYSDSTMAESLRLMNANTQKNDLAAFKEFLDSGESGAEQYVSSVRYSYDVPIYVYNQNAVGGTALVNPGQVYDKMFGSTFSYMMNFTSRAEVFSEMADSPELLDTQFELLGGSRWPQSYDEIVISVGKDNRIGDFALYTLGMRDQAELSGLMQRVLAGEDVVEEELVFTYDELLDLTFKLLLPTDYFEYDDAANAWRDLREKEDFDIDSLLDEKGVTLKVVGIIRPRQDTTATAMTGTVCYTTALTEHVISAVNASDIVKAQLAEPEVDVFTGVSFEQEQAMAEAALSSYGELGGIPTGAVPAGLAAASYDGNLEKLGVADPDEPSAIVFYPFDFEAKERIADIISNYNEAAKAAGEDARVITYTDYVGTLMSSVSTIINVISYVLIAFVAVSLVVSSIMIGVITNISVLERTKEIGVLRSIGASKRDVSRVFNAETLIIGFISGILGLGLTELLIIPINAIIYKLGGIRNVAALPWEGAVILLAISMLLTLIAGLIPSRAAAKKDPVVALRTE